MRLSSLAIAGALCAGVFVSAAAVEQPAGYRMSDYDAPVPAEAPGAITVSDETVYALLRTQRVAIIDVMPDIPRPKGLPEGTLWKGRTRISIPDAIWWPDAGFGELSAEVEARFKAGLADVTGGDKAAPILFLCRADCWMSWNASKRAATYGYETIFWYADGSTGWSFWDWPTEILKRADGL
ncbi:MAG: PQQ-dependent catabolism-associated CXXCW motif protein [Pseudomonadota bacterium]